MEITTWEDRERWGVGRMPSLYEIEGLAHDFLVLTRSLGIMRPDPWRIFAFLRRHYGLSIRWETPPETRGWSHRRWLFIRPGLSLEETLEDLVHELTHWFLTDECVPTATQDLIADQVILCWRMPRAAVTHVVNSCRGFIPALDILLLMYGKAAPALDVLVRAAMVCKVGLLVYTPSDGQLTVVGGGTYEVNVVLDEREAIACARRAILGGDPVPDARGFVAVPLRVGAEVLAVVAVDLVAREWVCGF